LSPDQASPEEILNLYFNRWPNLEEGFQDFSRKIELFTYTAGSERFFSTESLELIRDLPLNISSLLEIYLKILDLYVRWHFCPSGYENKDFSIVNQLFYSLKTRLKKEQGRVLVIFEVPPGFAQLKDLQYCLRRINEREVMFSSGEQLHLAIK